MKYVPPSIHLTAFSCPHCDVLTKQFWHTIHAEPSAPDVSPFVVTASNRDEYSANNIPDKEERKKMEEFLDQVMSGKPFLEASRKMIDFSLMNVALCSCFDCKELSIWIHDALVYPRRAIGISVNPDTPPDIQNDFNEASAIFEASPRGAAALLRLAIQKLCKVLNQPGKNINEDIKALVAGGLDVRVQRALDVLRVVGNESVHPGQIDLRDNRETAESLFRLFNLIVDKTISEPKHIADIYGRLPPDKLKAIEDRDKPIV